MRCDPEQVGTFIESCATQSGGVPAGKRTLHLGVAVDSTFVVGRAGGTSPTRASIIDRIATRRRCSGGCCAPWLPRLCALMMRATRLGLKVWSASARCLDGNSHGQALTWFDMGIAWARGSASPDVVTRFRTRYLLFAEKMRERRECIMNVSVGVAGIPQ